MTARRYGLRRGPTGQAARRDRLDDIAPSLAAHQGFDA